MKHHSISFDRNEYETLLRAVTVASLIYGPMGDFADPKFKKDSKQLDRLETLLCEHAEEFGFGNLIEEFDGKPVLDMESAIHDEIMEDMDVYDDYTVEETLSNKLAWRDFLKDHTKEEMDAMQKKNGGYFGAELYEYEKKYWDEFEKHSYDRIVIQEDQSTQNL
jgi:hypothetical protein